MKLWKLRRSGNRYRRGTKSGRKKEKLQTPPQLDRFLSTPSTTDNPTPIRPLQTSKPPGSCRYLYRETHNPPFTIRQAAAAQ
jgi:hypothetical protein